MRTTSGSRDPNTGDPYPHAWCAKDRWEGLDEPGMHKNTDPWKDCKQYRPQFGDWINEVKRLLNEKQVHIDEDEELKEYMRMYYDMNFTSDAAVFSEFKL